VVESRIGPRRCVVALGAIGWEPGRNVGRIVRAVEISLVASVAGRGQSRVVVVGMALCAGHRGMCARQRKRCGAVVKGRGRPSAGGMAGGAIRRKSSRDVVGIGSPGEICLMA